MPPVLISAEERSRFDDRSRTLLATLEANRAAILHELATIPAGSAGAIDRRTALAGTDRRIALLVREQPTAA